MVRDRQVRDGPSAPGRARGIWDRIEAREVSLDHVSDELGWHSRTLGATDRFAFFVGVALGKSGGRPPRSLMPAGIHRIRVRREGSVLLDSLWRHVCYRELGEKFSQEKASDCSVDLWTSR
eukprot:7681389-Pyramimonas_sp.AAC.1